MCPLCRQMCPLCPLCRQMFPLCTPAAPAALAAARPLANCVRQRCCPTAARPRRLGCIGPAAVRQPGLRQPGLHTKVCDLGFAWPRTCTAPQLHGPAGLVASAPQRRSPAAARPRRRGVRRPHSCAATGTAYQGMRYRVCVAPHLYGPAVARPRRFRVRRPRSCAAPGTANKGMSFRV